MIILASTSPRRKELLTEAEIPYKLATPNYEEIVDTTFSPEKNAEIFAHGKAKSVSSQYQDHWVLGVDTLVSFQGKILGKPKDRAEAKEMIQMFQGNNVQVLSGIALIHEKKEQEIVEHESSFVQFGKMTESDIESFLNTNEWVDKSGSFTIQRHGARYIKGIEGDYYNIVGLPLYRLWHILKRVRHV